MCEVIHMKGEGKVEGPLAMSEAELLALEQEHDNIVGGAKLVWDHLTNCEHSDAKTIAAFERILKYVGIDDEVCVVKLANFKQPAGEMAVHNED